MSMTIEVDPMAAEIIRRAQARAQSRGETLGAYLQHALPADVVAKKARPSQLDAWNAFVTGMTTLTKDLPAGHFVDDSREAMYDDRT
jgi:hypothetical protein